MLLTLLYKYYKYLIFRHHDIPNISHLIFDITLQASATAIMKLTSPLHDTNSNSNTFYYTKFLLSIFLLHYQLCRKLTKTSNFMQFLQLCRSLPHCILISWRRPCVDSEAGLLIEQSNLQDLTMVSKNVFIYSNSEKIVCFQE